MQALLFKWREVMTRNTSVFAGYDIKYQDLKLPWNRAHVPYTQKRLVRLLSDIKPRNNVQLLVHCCWSWAFSILSFVRPWWTSGEDIWSLCQVHSYMKKCTKTCFLVPNTKTSRKQGTDLHLYCDTKIPYTWIKKMQILKYPKLLARHGDWRSIRFLKESVYCLPLLQIMYMYAVNSLIVTTSCKQWSSVSDLFEMTVLFLSQKL